MGALGSRPADSGAGALEGTHHAGLGNSKAHSERALAAVRRIPAGRVATYGEIAALAGKPARAPAVGNIMRECRDPGIPCHRVIGAGGTLAGYGGNLQLKRQLLRNEGVEVGVSRIRHFNEVRFRRSMELRGPGFEFRA